MRWWGCQARNQYVLTVWNAFRLASWRDKIKDSSFACDRSFPSSVFPVIANFPNVGRRVEDNTRVKNCLKHSPSRGDDDLNSCLRWKYTARLGNINVPGIFTDASETTSQRQETTVTAKHRCSPLIFSECAHTPVGIYTGPLSRNTLWIFSQMRRLYSSLASGRAYLLAGQTFQSAW